MICKRIAEFSVEKSNSKGSLSDRKGGKSNYFFTNPHSKTYYQIDFEKDVFEDNDTKCDFGIKTESSIFFIELKGSDVKKGVVQLLETIKTTEKCFANLDLRARLIVSKYPKPDIVRKTKEYKDLVKKLNHLEGKNENLIIKTSFTENI
jgi:hypothetical protein